MAATHFDLYPHRCLPYCVQHVVPLGFGSTCRAHFSALELRWYLPAQRCSRKHRQRMATPARGFGRCFWSNLWYCRSAHQRALSRKTSCAKGRAHQYSEESPLFRWIQPSDRAKHPRDRQFSTPGWNHNWPRTWGCFGSRLDGPARKAPAGTTGYVRRSRSHSHGSLHACRASKRIRRGSHSRIGSSRHWQPQSCYRET